MIGLLEVPASKQLGGRRPTGLRLLSFALASLALLTVVSSSTPSWAQRPDDDGGGGQTQTTYRIPQEPPKPKPNLAERNNLTPNPLMTQEEEKAFAKIRRDDYPSALRSQNPRKSEEETILAGVKDRVYRLTIPENWRFIANLRRDLVTDINMIAGDAHPRSRQIALDAAVKILPELLRDQPYPVKLNAVLLLGELDEKSPDVQAGQPARPYAAAAQPLIEVLQSSDQTTDIKVASLIGLRRILKDGRPPRSVRDAAAKVMVEELRAVSGPNLSAGLAWYQERLVDTLGTINDPRTAINQPIVVDALWETMLNDSLQPHVRTQAARSLSQLELDGTFNVGLLAHEIVKLCGKLAVQYNNRPNDAYWRECFMDLYFAFNAQERSETNEGWGLRKQVESGSLRDHRAMVDGAYQQVLKMVNAVMGHEPPRPVADATLQEAAKWMRANSPADQKLHPEAKTVEAIEKSHAPRDEETAVSQRNGTREDT